MRLCACSTMSVGLSSGSKEESMRPTRRERKKVHLFIGLFVSFVGFVRAVPGYGLVGDSSLPDVKMDTAVDPEEEASLCAETLKLDRVLAYARRHNPAIKAAQNRFVAAQERPAQVSALEDPMLTYEGFNIPENF